MRVRQSFMDRIDDWRRGQKDLPSQAEAIRRLVEIGLTARPSSQGDAPADPPTIAEPNDAAVRGAHKIAPLHLTFGVGR